MNQNSKVSAERVKRVVQNRFNPIRNLTPEYLGRALDSFERGELKVAAQLWDTIERRDDKLKCVIPKRKKAVGRYGWNVVMDEEGPRAEKHKEVLEYFFRNSVATDAVRGNFCRGWSGLVRQMLDALGKGYAAHEIIWDASGGGLSAEFKFVPLWFFENRTGKLRFLPEENSRDGVDLEDGEWMVTVEDGLMEASSIAYMFKTLPLKDWLIFCEKFGIPPVIGKTNAAKDSGEWNTMVDAVGNFMNDWAAVISLNSEIDFPQVGGSGERPFAALVDRMDRVLASMWRGGDLSSMSATAQDAGQGASVQSDESDLLEEDDAETICETLNKQVVPFVIKYALGDDSPLARVDIPLPSRSDNSQELEVDKAFVDMGIPQAVGDIRERYGRRTPDEGDDVIGESAATGGNMNNNPHDEKGLANVAGGDHWRNQEGVQGPRESDLQEEGAYVRIKRWLEKLASIIGRKKTGRDDTEEFRNAALEQLEDARRQDSAAMVLLLEKALKSESREELDAMLRDLSARLPEFSSDSNDQEEAWENLIISALVNGWEDQSKES